MKAQSKCDIAFCGILVDNCRSFPCRDKLVELESGGTYDQQKRYFEIPVV